MNSSPAVAAPLGPKRPWAVMWTYRSIRGVQQPWRVWGTYTTRERATSGALKIDVNREFQTHIVGPGEPRKAPT